jgi:hypothetical protein
MTESPRPGDAAADIHPIASQSGRLRSILRRVPAILLASWLAGCSAIRAPQPQVGPAVSPLPPRTTPLPDTPPHPLPAEGPVAATLPPALPRAPAATPPTVPPGMLYACAQTVDGEFRVRGIDYEPKVRDLCSRHPEMSACQYERDVCRRSGGRVFDTRGVEITREIEAEYDRKVMRARFRAG